MKIITILFMLLTFSLLGHASPTTHYDQLRNLFGQSHATPQNELNGWWSGRCYRPQYPDNSFGAIIVGRIVEIQHGNPNDGPLFPPSTETVHQYNVIGRGQQGAEAPADYFDDLSSDKVDFVETLIARGQLLTSYTANDSLKADFPQGNIQIATKNYVSTDASEKYFISRLNILTNRPPYWAGDDFAICYFFKRVR